MSVRDKSPDVLYVIVCGAPAASNVGEFIRLAQDAGWLVRVIDAAQLAALTGDRVRTGFRMLDEPDELPAADAVVVAPATFNLSQVERGLRGVDSHSVLVSLVGAGPHLLPS
jgi:hypothetical protein